MKFSERFFRFPIKIYDGVSIRRIMKKELNLDKEEEEDDIESPDWVSGVVKMPFWALNDLFYHEGFSMGRKPSDVAKEGFDITMVYQKDFGDFECLWDIKKFELKLDEFTDKYEKFYEELAAKTLAAQQ